MVLCSQIVNDITLKQRPRGAKLFAAGRFDSIRSVYCHSVSC